MEEAPENGKELLNSAHANGMNERDTVNDRKFIPDIPRKISVTLIHLHSRHAYAPVSISTLYCV
jgi:hypothetical protein